MRIAEHHDATISSLARPHPGADLYPVSARGCRTSACAPRRHIEVVPWGLPCSPGAICNTAWSAAIAAPGRRWGPEWRRRRSGSWARGSLSLHPQPDVSRAPHFHARLGADLWSWLGLILLAGRAACSSVAIAASTKSRSTTALRSRLQHPKRWNQAAATREQDQAEPRPEGQRQAEHENEVPEIHRVAGVAIGTARHDPLRRRRHSGPTAALEQPIAADQAVLQIAQASNAGPTARPRCGCRATQALVRHRERTQDEGLHRGAAEPMKKLLRHGCSAIRIMRSSSRFHRARVPARLARAAVLD